MDEIEEWKVWKEEDEGGVEGEVTDLISPRAASQHLVSQSG